MSVTLTKPNYRIVLHSGAAPSVQLLRTSPRLVIDSVIRGPDLAGNVPLADANTGLVGTSLKAAREDHVHPIASSMATQAYAAAQATAAQNAAQSYADAGDTTTLASAKTYADTKTALATSSAKGEVPQLTGNPRRYLQENPGGSMAWDVLTLPQVSTTGLPASLGLGALAQLTDAARGIFIDLPNGVGWQPIIGTYVDPRFWGYVADRVDATDIVATASSTSVTSASAAFLTAKAAIAAGRTVAISIDGAGTGGFGHNTTVTSVSSDGKTATLSVAAGHNASGALAVFGTDNRAALQAAHSAAMAAGAELRLPYGKAYAVTTSGNAYALLCTANSVIRGSGRDQTDLCVGPAFIQSNANGAWTFNGIGINAGLQAVIADLTLTTMPKAKTSTTYPDGTDSPQLQAIVAFTNANLAGQVRLQNVATGGWWFNAIGHQLASFGTATGSKFLFSVRDFELQAFAHCVSSFSQDGGDQHCWLIDGNINDFSVPVGTGGSQGYPYAHGVYAHPNHSFFAHNVNFKNSPALDTRQYCIQAYSGSGRNDDPKYWIVEKCDFSDSTPSAILFPSTTHARGTASVCTFRGGPCAVGTYVDFLGCLFQNSSVGSYNGVVAGLGGSGGNVNLIGCRWKGNVGRVVCGGNVFARDCIAYVDDVNNNHTMIFDAQNSTDFTTIENFTAIGPAPGASFGAVYPIYMKNGKWRLHNLTLIGQFTIGPPGALYVDSGGSGLDVDIDKAYFDVSSTFGNLYAIYVASAVPSNVVKGRDLEFSSATTHHINCVSPTKQSFSLRRQKNPSSVSLTSTTLSPSPNYDRQKVTSSPGATLSTITENGSQPTQDAYDGAMRWLQGDGNWNFDENGNVITRGNNAVAANQIAGLEYDTSQSKWLRFL